MFCLQYFFGIYFINETSQFWLHIVLKNQFSVIPTQSHESPSSYFILHLICSSPSPVWLAGASASPSLIVPEFTPTFVSLHPCLSLHISLILLTGIKAFLQSEDWGRYLSPTGAFFQLTNPILRHSCHSLHNSTLAPTL